MAYLRTKRANADGDRSVTSGDSSGRIPTGGVTHEDRFANVIWEIDPVNGGRVGQTLDNLNANGKIYGEDSVLYDNDGNVYDWEKPKNDSNKGEKSNTLLYIGIGVAAFLLFYLLMRKK